MKRGLPPTDHLPAPVPLRAPMPRRLRLLLIAAAAGLASFAAVSAYFAFRFTSPEPRPVGVPGDYLPATTETVTFAAADGVVLRGWYAAPSAAAPSPIGPARAVVLLHGFGSTRRQVLARAGWLHRQGFAVLLYDARGHGESAAARVSVGWFETSDLEGALAYLRTRGHRDIGLVGVSQGAATIALAATRLRDVRWIALESMYPTLRDALDCRLRLYFRLPGWLAGFLLVPFAEWRLKTDIDLIAPRDHVARLPSPVYFMHGDADRHTLLASALDLHARAPSPKSLWIVPGAGHNDLYSHAPRDYEARFIAFLQYLR